MYVLVQELLERIEQCPDIQHLQHIVQVIGVHTSSSNAPKPMYIYVQGEPVIIGWKCSFIKYIFLLKRVRGQITWGSE